MSETVNQPNNSRVPLLGPLLEPGRMLLVCVAAFAVAFFVCRYFAEDIFSFLIQPLMRAGQKSISYTQVFDAFFVRDKVAFFSAVMVLLPVLATQSWYLVGSQAHNKERRALLPFSLATPTLFLLGVATAYFLAIPMMLHLLIALPSVSGDVPQLPLPAIGKYFNFATRFLFAFGLAFLLPVLLMLLEHAKIVNRRQLISARRYAIVGAFAITLAISPPDAGSLLLIAITLAVLYEAAIIGIRLTEHRRARAGQRVANG